MSKILIKWPTRSRPELFLNNLANYVSKIHDKSKVSILVSIDSDDATMSNEVVTRANSLYHDIRFMRGLSASKIHACNRDVAGYKGDWDILCLASDDMVPQYKGWDKLITDQMEKHYPDMDGCLWFNDSHQDRVCTFSIIGRKFYDSFGYIYHPSYVSLFCDEEFTNVAKKMGKIKYFQQVLFKHEHPIWMGNKKIDQLYQMNEKYFKTDQSNFLKRTSLFYP